MLVVLIVCCIVQTVFILLFDKVLSRIAYQIYHKSYYDIKDNLISIFYYVTMLLMNLYGLSIFDYFLMLIPFVIIIIILITYIITHLKGKRYKKCEEN